MKEKIKTLHKPKILHFEDDPFLQEIYKDKFIRNGFDYKVFGEYKNHLDIIAKEKPNLLIKK